MTLGPSTCKALTRAGVGWSPQTPGAGIFVLRGNYDSSGSAAQPVEQR